MLRGILLAGAAALFLSAPALAMAPAGMPASAPATASGSASQCDGCSSQDQDDTGNAGQTQQTAQPGGSGVTGPVTNPSTPQPAHTEVPSHAGGAGPGGSPKG